MSDNAGFGDNSESAVHPGASTGDGGGQDTGHDQSGNTDDTATGAIGNQGDDSDALFGPEGMLMHADGGDAQGENGNEDLGQGGLEGDGIDLMDSEGFDPDTLANLAALSRIEGLDGDDEMENQAGVEGEDVQMDDDVLAAFLPGALQQQDEDQGKDKDASDQAPAGSVTTQTGVQSEVPPTTGQSPEQTSGTTRAESTQPAATATVTAGPSTNPPRPSPARENSEPPTGSNLNGPATASSSTAPPPQSSSPARPTGESSIPAVNRLHSRPQSQNGDSGRDASGSEDDDDERYGSHEDEDRDEDGYGSSGYVYENGRMKRKRNRTVLSCTECHRRKRKYRSTIAAARADDPISLSPQNNIKRGVPSMCRLEDPPAAATTSVPPPEKKKRKTPKDVPVSVELGLRVQALESLIRSGSSLDPDSASAAAMETIMHATRAANSGSVDASSALAQLSESAMRGEGIPGMSLDAQSNLLMDVLQQLSVASMQKNTTENGHSDQDSQTTSISEIWSSTPAHRPDTNTRINAAYEADTAGTKLNLSLHGFREDNGRIFIPPTVRYVEKQMRNENILANEALPIWGDERFLQSALKFAYGEDTAHLKKRNIAAIQAVSLTGAMRLAGTFLARFPAPPGRQVFIPNPTTEEDATALRDAGLEIRHYRFLDRKNGGVDFDGLKEDLGSAPEKSAVLLFVSGSIPTGTELSNAQWKILITILKEKSLIPLVIMAFQGLTTGDISKDAHPVRMLVQERRPIVLCQSFDAMMGLYSDSPSAVSIVTHSTETRDRVDSQLRSVARGMMLHPSPWGAHVAHTILSDPKLYPAWLNEIKAMSDRLRSVREKLYDLLANKLKTPGNWIHLKKSAGLYASTMLPPAVNETLTTKRHVHLLPHGSFSLGCLNAAKIESLAKSIDAMVLQSIREAEEQQAQQIAMELALNAAREAAAREEAEKEEAAAREEDQMLMERSIQSAIEAQKRAEEDERRREEEDRGLEEAVRKAAERAEVARQAEAILASISAGAMF